ncbi:hypothetical protein AJ78_06027 [Emergomyces pasteurianus Ep9510]|uniref:Uncharacterized protein n=1 Tax=Emergomyces pasteurianus Ep9510 TaxID=1447872 RepID=A0A1J9QBJ0_9EURO|nr:hypothetical protein AJ78_06027 [Emergomyces pasteurianus Ep9510]
MKENLNAAHPLALSFMPASPTPDQDIYISSSQHRPVEKDSALPPDPPDTPGSSANRQTVRSSPPVDKARDMGLACIGKTELHPQPIICA